MLLVGPLTQNNGNLALAVSPVDRGANFSAIAASGTLSFDAESFGPDGRYGLRLGFRPGGHRQRRARLVCQRRRCLQREQLVHRP